MIISWPSKSSIIFQLQHFHCNLLPMYFYSGVCLFVSLCGIAYAMLGIVGKQIQCNRQQEISFYVNDFWKNQLTKWKIQYYFIEEFVYKIDQYFGFFLLVVLTSYFVRMVNISFIFLNCFKQSFYNSKYYSSLTIGIYAFYLVQDFINFSVIVYLPYLIKHEVLLVLNKYYSISSWSQVSIFCDVGN